MDLCVNLLLSSHVHCYIPFATNLRMYCHIMGVCGLRVLCMHIRWQELHTSNISLLYIYLNPHSSYLGGGSEVGNEEVPMVMESFVKQM